MLSQSRVGHNMTQPLLTGVLVRLRPCNAEPTHSLWLNEILQDHPTYSKLRVQPSLSLRKAEGAHLAPHCCSPPFSGKMS